MLHVKWFCDRADVERHKEETEICEAEITRVIEWHQQTAANWRKLAKENGMRPGHAAYAHKHAVMHQCLGLQCSEPFEEAKKKVESL